MRFLVDNALYPSVAAGLRDRGHDAVHVRDRNLQSADDYAIFEYAANDDRTIVSADTDFGTLLALHRAQKPSVVIFRRGVQRRPADQVRFLLANITAIETATASGAVVVLEDSRIRIRQLPIVGDASR